MIRTLLPEVFPTVRMMVPPIAYRRAIDEELARFFHSHRAAAFKRAVARLCRYYNGRRPRVYWYEYLDWGKTAGKTYEDGRIHLVHPENWKRGRKYNSERRWINMIYHEMGHYIQMRREGVQPSWMVFIPFRGAAVGARSLGG